MRKAVSVILTLLTVVLIAAGRILQHFSRTRLGLVRAINHLENKKLSFIPFESMQYIYTSIGIVILVIASIRLLMKKHSSGIPAYIFVFAAAFLNIVLIITVITCSVQTMRCYNIILLTLFIGAVFTALCGIINTGCKNAGKKLSDKA